MKLLVAAVAAVASLVFAGFALAANTATVAVSTAGTATTIHVAAPQSDDAIAAVNIFVPSGYTMNLTAAQGATIGSENATAFAHDAGLALPLTGPVTIDNPVAPANDPCAPGTHGAVWDQNLSVAGQTLVVKIYVDQTSGASAALGAYVMKICLPPWDVPAGTPGRSFQGAQLLSAQFTVNNVFTAPTGGLAVWHTLFTPYNPGQGTVNAAGTFEARALAGSPALTLSVKKRKKGTYVASGKLTEGGQPVAGASVTLGARTATTGATGTWAVTGKATGRKPISLKATATVKERDATSVGCTPALPQTVAPAGCATATLASWTVSSPVVKYKP